jgi:hypothetical protein
LLIGLTLAWGLCSGSLADDEPPSRKVTVSVMAILASKKSDQIDPLLKDIARQIRKKDKELKGFRVGKISCKEVPVQTAETFDLVADQKASIVVLKTADKENRIQLKISPPTVGDITYTTTCGKFFPIMTTYQTPNGESLIIAVRVQPCNKSK